jgi:cell division septum initiation protein DivIVA
MPTSEEDPPVDVHDKLDELTLLIESARSMPMSASCIVHRGELLGQLDELRELLPEELEHARTLLQDRDAVVDDGRRESERLVADGRRESEQLLEDGRRESQRLVDEAYAERARLVAETEVLAQAREESERVRAEAWGESERVRAQALAEAEDMRRDTDDYVDAKLASFEVVLDKTLTSVHRGRQKLASRRDPRDDEDGDLDPDAT